MSSSRLTVERPGVVFDTNTVLSALLFSRGRLAWLRAHWQSAICIPLISSTTAAELARVLSYPKFRLQEGDRLELLGEYIPFCEVVTEISTCPVLCRDPQDQPFLDLSQSGAASVLVSGDKDLLALAGQATFAIETPEEYRKRAW